MVRAMDGGGAGGVAVRIRRGGFGRRKDFVLSASTPTPTHCSIAICRFGIAEKAFDEPVPRRRSTSSLPSSTGPSATSQQAEAASDRSSSRPSWHPAADLFRSVQQPRAAGRSSKRTACLYSVHRRTERPVHQPGGGPAAAGRDRHRPQRARAVQTCWGWASPPPATGDPAAEGLAPAAKQASDVIESRRWTASPQSRWIGARCSAALSARPAQTTPAPWCWCSPSSTSAPSNKPRRCQRRHPRQARETLGLTPEQGLPREAP